MRELIPLTLLIPLYASAQSLPPGYYCTHFDDYYQNGTPPAGQPDECEAIGPHATDPSFIYWFPLDPPPAQQSALTTLPAPEIDPATAVGATTFLGMLLVVGLSRRSTRRS